MSKQLFNDVKSVRSCDDVGSFHSGTGRAEEAAFDPRQRVVDRELRGLVAFKVAESYAFPGAVDAADAEDAECDSRSPVDPVFMSSRPPRARLSVVWLQPSQV